jgi:hypothetical protein
MKKTIGKNKLALNKDTLRKLTASDLSQVQGGGITQNVVCAPSARICASTSPPKYLC